MNRTFYPTVAALAVLISACNAGPNSTAPPPPAPRADGIVLVTVEDWWSAADERSPAAMLALPGTVVANDAVTASPQARAAVASMLTGLAPDKTGVLDAFTSPLPPDAPLIASRLKDAGWASAAFVANPLVGYGSGFERGFELFDAPKTYAYGPFKRLPPLRPAIEPAANFHAWLKSVAPDRRFFAWIHLNGAVRGMGAKATQADPNAPAVRLEGAMREILAAVQERSGAKVAVVVAGVAGKVEPASETASGYFAESTVLQVPFAHRPGVLTGASPDAPVWGPDVAAIVAAEAGIDAGAIDGALPWSADASRSREAWIAQGRTDFQWPVEVAAVAGGKLTIREIPGDSPALRGGPGGAALVARAREIVTAAGITWPSSAKKVPLADRATRMKTMPRIHAARLQAWDPAPRYAATAFEEVLKSDPSNIGALIESGEIQALGQLPKRARAVLDRALAMDPASAHAWHWLAHVELIDKQDARARAMLEASDLLLPNDADVLYDMACVASRGGDAEGAETYLRRAWTAGFRSVEHIQTDPDLRSLRDDARFTRFMQEVVR